MGLRGWVRRLEHAAHEATLRGKPSRTARVTTTTLKAARCSCTAVIASAQGQKASPSRGRPRR